MLDQLKSVIESLKLPLIFKVQSVPNPSSSGKERKPKRCAYQIAERRPWTEPEYNLLLLHSFLGKSRSEL